MRALPAVTLLVVGFSTAQAEPGTLTLACTGTTTFPMGPPSHQPVSMGIIVNFTARYVQGLDFGYPGLDDFPVKITAMNDVTVEFSGSQRRSPSRWTIDGSIDRVTGDLNATSTMRNIMSNEIVAEQTYALKCRPAQRLF